MEENLRFITLLDELKEKKLINGYAHLASIIGIRRSGISDIKTGRKKVSIELLRQVKNAFPIINTDWVVTGKGDIFLSQDTTEHLARPGIEHRLLDIIQEKESVILHQAEEIGQLKERLYELQRKKGKDAPSAQTTDIVHAG